MAANDQDRADAFADRLSGVSSNQASKSQDAAQRFIDRLGQGGETGNARTERFAEGLSKPYQSSQRPNTGREQIGGANEDRTLADEYRRASERKKA